MTFTDYHDIKTEEGKALIPLAIAEARKGNVNAMRFLDCYPCGFSYDEIMAKDFRNMLILVFCYAFNHCEYVKVLARLFRYGIIVDEDIRMAEILETRAREIDLQYGKNFVCLDIKESEPDQPLFLGNEEDDEYIRRWLKLHYTDDSPIGITALSVMILLITEGRFTDGMSYEEELAFITDMANSRGNYFALSALGCLVSGNDVTWNIVFEQHTDVKSLLVYYKTLPKTEDVKHAVSNFYRFGIGVPQDVQLADCIWELRDNVTSDEDSEEVPF